MAKEKQLRSAALSENSVEEDETKFQSDRNFRWQSESALLPHGLGAESGPVTSDIDRGRRLEIWARGVGGSAKGRGRPALRDSPDPAAASSFGRCRRWRSWDPGADCHVPRPRSLLNSASYSPPTRSQRSRTEALPAYLRVRVGRQRRHPVSLRRPSRGLFPPPPPAPETGRLSEHCLPAPAQDQAVPQPALAPRPGTRVFFLQAPDVEPARPWLRPKLCAGRSCSRTCTKEAARFPKP
ncbi:uncharacterized protein LOC144578693 [Callithrix jacchus]